MRVLSTLLAVVISFSGYAQDFFTQVDDLLKKRVTDGLVDYRYIKENPKKLDGLLKLVATAPNSKGETEKAFLINAYNLFVIKGIVDHYPAQGPLAIDGFFDKQSFNLRGNKITLNGLEKETLAKQFPDARLHFALVCAAIGCPKLGGFAYFPKLLDAQLEKQTRNSINDPDFIKVKGNQVQLSQIFEWYDADFGGKEKLISYVQKYYLPKVKLSPEYSFYEYDWNLNEQK